ncbi:MAG: fluoride efflux transporter CrcB [Flavobacterium sp.]|nr:fluoride efflux transporter CrcB [Flavobacterium sp.]
MKVILAIGIGSFFGGVIRYQLSQFIQSKIVSGFPFGTFTVNIIGCFCIGLVFALTERGNLSAEWKLIITTGLLGGFTTFSAFSMETVTLLRDGQLLYATGYAVSSVITGLLATFAGIFSVKFL